MLKNLSSYVKSFISDRILEINQSVFTQNEEIMKAAEKSNSIRRQIIDLLPEEHKHLANDHEEAESHWHFLIEDIMYTQGLKDGIRTAKAVLKL